MRFFLIYLLLLLPTYANAATYNHDHFNTQPKDIIREFEAYTVSFDSKDDNNGDNKPDIWGVPEYVAYEIKHYEGSCIPTGPRPSKWMTDAELHEQGIAPDDASYAYPKEWRSSHPNWYERGHLCMKMIAERVSNEAAYNTHYVLNAVPQRAAFNKGPWEDLEEMTAAWAQRYGDVWIITGPVFKNKTVTDWIGETNKGELPVAIPDALYKIVVKNPGIKLDVLAFLYSQEGEAYAKGPFLHEHYLTTVDEIEKLTGLDFLTDLPDDVEREVESRKAVSLWPVGREDYVEACGKSN